MSEEVSDPSLATRYWCHMCSQMVNPATTDTTEIKCPYCEEGFLEEMNDTATATTNNDNTSREELNSGDVGSEQALSLWAPILLGMIGGSSSSRRRSSRRFRRREEEQDDDDDDDDGDGLNQDRELDSVLRRRRRSSAALLQLLQGLRAELTSEPSDSDPNRDRDRERENVILINPFNQAIILHGSVDGSQNQNSDDSPGGGGAAAGTSLGDYFVGPGLEMLLQHLAENDPNRYGTPPALKEGVEAMPMVKIDKNMSCPVCLEDFEIGAEAKEIPCTHKFHSGCILPWLELHSSCPVCRFQMPVDESKASSNPPAPAPPPPPVATAITASGLERTTGGSGGGREDGGNGSRLWVPFQWPFNGLFSSTGSPRRNSSGPSSLPPPPPPHSSGDNPPANEDV